MLIVANLVKMFIAFYRIQSSCHQAGWFEL